MQSLYTVRKYFLIIFTFVEKFSQLVKIELFCRCTCLVRLLGLLVYIIGYLHTHAINDDGKYFDKLII